MVNSELKKRVAIFFIFAAWPFMQSCAAEDNSLQHINLPPGFSIEVFAEVPNARSLALGEHGNGLRPQIVVAAPSTQSILETAKGK